MAPLRLIFMGTPAFAVPALAALIESRHKVIAAYTRAPKPAGRGMREAKSPVHRLAEKHDIPVFTPRNFKREEDAETFREHKADAAVVAAYGLILPEEVLEAPRLGCINIHASLLPRWRGAAPIQRAILAGDRESGISIMVMDEGLDTGPVLAREAVALTEKETGGRLHDKLAALGASLIVPALEGFAAGKLVPAPQDEAKAAYAPKIQRGETLIDWEKSATEVDRQVRAFQPRPGAWFPWRGKRFQVLEGTTSKGRGKPGEVLDDRLTVACGRGAYRIEKLQREGKKPLSADAFLRGTPVKKGEVLA